MRFTVKDKKGNDHTYCTDFNDVPQIYKDLMNNPNRGLKNNFSNDPTIVQRTICRRELMRSLKESFGHKGLESLLDNFAMARLERLAKKQ